MRRRQSAPSPSALRLPRGQRLGLYVVGLGLWLSGALWLLYHYGSRQPGEFGLGTHPLEPWWLRLHGAFAFAAIWMFGLLWGAHIAPGWAGGRHRRSGGWLVGSLVWLTVSGFLLYYLTGDQSRSAASLLHWSVGLACPALFATHRLGSGRERSSARARRPREPRADAHTGFPERRRRGTSQDPGI